MRQDKQKAISLRKRGRSYNEISRILDISKGTLSSWLRNVKMPIGIKKKFWDKTRKKWARNITRFNKRQAKAVRKRAEEFQRIAAKDIGRLSKRELLLVGTALYWAEGYKRNRWVLRFANSYPVMIKLIDKKLQEPLINAVVDKYIPSFVLLRIS